MHSHHGRPICVLFALRHVIGVPLLRWRPGARRSSPVSCALVTPQLRTPPAAAAHCYVVDRSRCFVTCLPVAICIALGAQASSLRSHSRSLKLKSMSSPSRRRPCHYQPSRTASRVGSYGGEEWRGHPFSLFCSPALFALSSYGARFGQSKALHYMLESEETLLFHIPPDPSTIGNV